MKQWVIRESTNLYVNLAIIEAPTNKEALQAYAARYPHVYKNCPIKPYRGTQAIFYGYNHSHTIEAWEHTSLF